MRQEVKLGTLGDIFIGLTYKPENVVDTGGTVVLRSSNIQEGKIDLKDIVRVDFPVREKLWVKDNDILMCSRNGSAKLVGKTALINNLPEDMTFGAFMTIIRTPYNNYLQYYFKSPFFRRQLNSSATTTINQITRSMLDDMVVPVFDTTTAEQITETLSKCEQIIYDRKRELEQLDELIKARFVELFGDPMVNPRGYDIKSYGDLFELNAGGTPSKSKPEYWEDGTISWIGSNLCQNVILYENDGKYISQEGYDHSSARLFPVDTVLIALVGATIGKTALLKFETSTNQNVLGVRHIAESGYNPMFVYYYTQFLYQKFMNIGDGGFNMASKGFVSELPMYDVELSVQNEFAAFAEQVDKSKVVVQKALDEAQLLFDSLMQQYFG